MTACSANLESGQAWKQLFWFVKGAELEFVKRIYTLLLWHAMQLPARIRFLKWQELHSGLCDDNSQRGTCPSPPLGFGADPVIAGLVWLAFEEQLHTPFAEGVRVGFGPTAHPQHLRAPHEVIGCD